MQSNKSRPRIRKSSSQLIVVQMSVEKAFPVRLNLENKNKGKRRSIQFLQSNERRPRIRKSSSELIAVQISAFFQSD